MKKRKCLSIRAASMFVIFALMLSLMALPAHAVDSASFGALGFGLGRYFFHKSYSVTSCDINLEVTHNCTLRTGPAKSYSSAGSTTSGQKFSAIAYSINSSGNLWYKTGDNKFIYSENVKVLSDAIVKDVLAPTGSLTYGKPFVIGGVITTDVGNSHIRDVTVRILNAAGETVMSNTDTVKDNSYSLKASKLDNLTTFNTLANNTAYIYQILVTEQVDTGNACAMIANDIIYESAFQIGNVAPTGGTTNPIHTSNTGIITGYSPNVNAGSIRFIRQNPGSTLFDSRYWGSWAYDANSECYTSCISMALSYIGINKTPEIILTVNNGLTYASGWGAALMSVSLDAGLSHMDPNEYSPLMLHFVAGCPGYDPDWGHWVLVIGGGNGTYTILDPASDSTWTLSQADYRWSYIGEIQQYAK